MVTTAQTWSIGADVNTFLARINRVIYGDASRKGRNPSARAWGEYSAQQTPTTLVEKPNHPHTKKATTTRYRFLHHQKETARTGANTGVCCSMVAGRASSTVVARRTTCIIAAGPSLEGRRRVKKKAKEKNM